MPVKTDRNDARAIAQVMRVGWYSAVHVQSEASQELRMLLTNRKTLLTKQIDIENEVRGTLRVFGLKNTPALPLLERGSDLFSPELGKTSGKVKEKVVEICDFRHRREAARRLRH